MRPCAASLLRPERRLYVLYAAAVLLFLGSAVLGILCGATPLPLSDMVSAICRGAAGPGEKIFLYVRLPRTLGTLLVGASLSAAGAVIQTVLANRLASPGILGVNAGAGLAVVIAALFGIYGGFGLSLMAFLGALLAVIPVSFCTRRLGSGRGTVILVGVAINSLLNALSDSIVTLRPDIGVMRNDFRMGDFSAVTYPKLIPAAVLVLLSLAVLVTLAGELDLLTLGDENARGLGMDTRLSRGVFLILSSLLAGCAVSLAGLLSFVGLLVPHSVRRMGVECSRHLLPLSILFGAGFVTLCDTAARTLFAPYEIPVGILMAFLGAPFFLFLLLGKRGDRHA
ncbi:MAG: iron ABC transporter permease [Clostridia bacterium]|nr:iron ABC transporter permease [Clostridia bacterium]